MTEGKKMELRLATEGWKTHKNKPECLPLCLYNILLDLSRSENYYEFLPFSVQILKTIAEYSSESGSSWSAAVRGIESRLKRRKVKEWSLQSEEGKGIKQEKLCKILSDENCSYPLVTLGPEYLSERYKVPLEGHPHLRMDHCVIVLECGEEEIVIFDPYSPFDNDSLPVIRLKKYTFERYWVASDPAKGVMWFQRMCQTLDKYMVK